MQKWKLIVGLVVVATASTGCKRIIRKVIGETAESLSGPSAEEKAVGLYVEGFNIMVDDGLPCSEAYLSRVPEEGPEPGKAYSFSTLNCGHVADKLASIQANFKTAESDASDSMKGLVNNANSTLGQLQTLSSTFKEITKYYDSAAYKGDNGAKGKVLHGQMVAASGAFRASMSKFEADLSIIEEKQTAAELEKYASDKSYSYWFRKSIADANKLVKAKAEDTAAFEKALKEFQQASEPFKAFVKGKGNDLNPAFKSFVGIQDTFDSKASAFLASAKENAPPQQLEQAYQQLVSQYNAMISVGGSLRQLEDNNLLK